MKKVAVVKDDGSGRRLELWSNQPGVQFYTGNFLDHVEGKGGAVYEIHDGLCLETQGFPDSVNHPQFPSQIVNPGEVYKHDMILQAATDGIKYIFLGPIDIFLRLILQSENESQSLIL
ncbi:hypothetical protein KSP39_PZI003013 [Platanthera zijinensis]|uniref:Uncharacterized protein n=1 Tax=Platanthera zijinensis TaxID=2320716 RepID=A0AAP0BV35_9ASPA